MATVAKGATKEFVETVTINANKDLTGYTAQWIARKPDGTLLTKAASIAAPTTGEVKYVTAEADLDQAGNWSYRWKLTSAGSVDWTDEVGLLVVP